MKKFLWEWRAQLIACVVAVLVLVAMFLASEYYPTDTDSSFGSQRQAPRSDMPISWEKNFNRSLSPDENPVFADGDELIELGDESANDSRFGSPSVWVFDLATGDLRWSAYVGDGDVWVTDDAIVVYADDTLEVVDRQSYRPRFTLEDIDSAMTIAVTQDGVASVSGIGEDAVLKFFDIESGDEQWSTGIAVENSDALSYHVAAPYQARDMQIGASTEQRLRRAQESPLVYSFPKPSGAPGEPQSAMYTPHSVVDGKKHGRVKVGDYEGVLDRGFVTTTDDGNVVTMTHRRQCESTFTITGPKLQDRGSFTMRGGDEELCAHPAPRETVVDDDIYACDSEGRPQLVDMDTGKAVWTAKEQGEPFTVVDGIAVYVVDEQDVKAVEVDSGTTLWSTSYESEEYSQDDYAYADAFGSGDGMIFLSGVTSSGVDVKTGRELWQHDKTLVAFTDKYLVFYAHMGEDSRLQVVQWSKS